MRSRTVHLLSWFAGLAGLAIVVWYFRPSDFISQVESVGVWGGFGWLFLTLCARMLLVEVAVLPIRALGYSFRRADAFWLGWIRTFVNQIVPLLGLAIYSREVRRKANIPWSVVVALSTPMVLLAAAALSVIGLFAVLSNAEYMGQSGIPMLITFAVVGSGSVFVATHVAWMIDRLPGATHLFAEQSAAAFRRLSDCNRLIAGLIGLHVLAILVRGARIWLLFVLFGAEMSVAAAVLVIVIAESTTLFQVTP
ncbi:MAG: lysylphosphatidylglycerol synthase domain-containing protein, partial [Woeseia sp.]